MFEPVCSTKNFHYSMAVLNRKMSLSDIASAIILFALVCIAHMVFHLFAAQNNIPFAQFSFGYGEMQGFQMPFTGFQTNICPRALEELEMELSFECFGCYC